MAMISSFDGTQLYMNREVSAANRCVAVIVHGLCEHQGRYDYLADLFHRNGIGTYRFDHRGHGRSAGENAYYADFNDMLDDVNVVVDMALAENPARPVFLVGHSMAGSRWRCTALSIRTNGWPASSPAARSRTITNASSPPCRARSIRTCSSPTNWAAASVPSPRWWNGTSRTRTTASPSRWDCVTR